MLVAKLQAAAQQTWSQARELSHPPLCCRNGAVLEPPLPRINVRHSADNVATTN